MRQHLLVGIAVVAVMFTAACEPLVAPDPPTGSAVHVSGRVLAYYHATEFSAIGGAKLVGWVDGGAHGGPTGRIPLDVNGRFDVTVERGVRLRLYAGGGTGDEIYQPCAVTVVATGNVSRDVTVVDDYSIIGAAIPPSFLEGTRILSGQVYETVPGVGRQPVPFATVSVAGFRDWNHDLGWPIAITRSDQDGRYIICGLEGEATATVYVINPIHEMSVFVVDLNGDTVLDIELTRNPPGPTTAFVPAG
jgi:hypothetical protein